MLFYGSSPLFRVRQYESFIIDSYEWKPLEGTIELRYSLDDEIKFIETLTFPSAKDWPRTLERAEELGRAFFALHIIGGISYYKTCLPKKIVIRSGTLTKAEADFWNDVYENGLGEFFFKNDIDYNGLIQFPFSGEATTKSQPANKPTSQQAILVPIGGGKDSLVTMELLRKGGKQCTLFRMGGHPVIDTLAEMAGLPLLTIKRALSPALFALNADGALNGHVPISAYLSCVTIVCALLYAFDAIAMSNERSASEGNVEFHGKEINHQWSKSIAFERAFREYLQEFVTQSVEYFSLLRPLSELHITKLLTASPRYLPKFTSCNENWKILSKKETKRGSVWCGKCPKCAFAFALLAAFLPAEELNKIFGKNFFDVEELQGYYRELFALEGIKPFECVGTPEETSAAFLMAHKRGDMEGTKAMQMFIKEVLPSIKKQDALIDAMFTPSSEHCIPSDFTALLPK